MRLVKCALLLLARATHVKKCETVSSSHSFKAGKIAFLSPGYSNSQYLCLPFTLTEAVKPNEDASAFDRSRFEYKMISIRMYMIWNHNLLQKSYSGPQCETSNSYSIHFDKRKWLFSSSFGRTRQEPLPRTTLVSNSQAIAQVLQVSQPQKYTNLMSLEKPPSAAESSKNCISYSSFIGGWVSPVCYALTLLRKDEDSNFVGCLLEICFCNIG